MKDGISPSNITIRADDWANTYAKRKERVDQHPWKENTGCGTKNNGFLDGERAGIS